MTKISTVLGEVWLACGGSSQIETRGSVGVVEAEGCWTMAASDLGIEGWLRRFERLLGAAETLSTRPRSAARDVVVFIVAIGKECGQVIEWVGL